MTITGKAPAEWGLPREGILLRVPDGTVFLVRPTRLRDVVRLPHRRPRRRTRPALAATARP